MTLDDVRAARARLDGIIHVTPCAHSETLSAMTGARVFVKLENLQMTGSFKERGARNKLKLLKSSLNPEPQTLNPKPRTLNPKPSTLRTRRHMQVLVVQRETDKPDHHLLPGLRSPTNGLCRIGIPFVAT